MAMHVSQERRGLHAVLAARGHQALALLAAMRTTDRRNDVDRLDAAKADHGLLRRVRRRSSRIDSLPGHDPSTREGRPMGITVRSASPEEWAKSC
jgi:hypothetical protein